LLEKLTLSHQLSIALFVLAKISGLTAPAAFFAGNKFLAWFLIGFDVFFLVMSVLIALRSSREAEAEGGSI
jgi:hypothetical protein